MLSFPPPLEEILDPLRREKLTVDLVGLIYRGYLVHVGMREEGKSFMTLKCPIVGNVRIAFKDIKRVWHKSKIVWRIKKIKDDVRHDPEPY